MSQFLEGNRNDRFSKGVALDGMLRLSPSGRVALRASEDRRQENRRSLHTLGIRSSLDSSVRVASPPSPTPTPARGDVCAVFVNPSKSGLMNLDWVQFNARSPALLTLKTGTNGSAASTRRLESMV